MLNFPCKENLSIRLVTSTKVLVLSTCNSTILALEWAKIVRIVMNNADPVL